MNSVRRLRVRRCVPECGAPQFVATRADHVNEGFWQIIFAQERLGIGDGPTCNKPRIADDRLHRQRNRAMCDGYVDADKLDEMDVDKLEAGSPVPSPETQSKALDPSLYGADSRTLPRLVKEVLRPMVFGARAAIYRGWDLVALHKRIGALEARADELHATRAELGVLVGELRARPYAARTDMLHRLDEQGRPQIGFRGIGPAQRTGYLGFEDIFRGPEELVRGRQQGYVELVRGHGRVIDIGCGRGEFLDLLGEAGIEAIGVDTNIDMVELCRQKGHRVDHMDGINFLNRCEERSLGAVFCAQVIEHLTYEQLDRLFALAIKKLVPNGVLVLETVNPHSVRAMQGFWVDPTHLRPIPPDAVVALCWLHGFAEAIVVFPTGTGELERDLYETGEYGVVARTALAD
jgi:SAM-dependent methyltransferase